MLGVYAIKEKPSSVSTFFYTRSWDCRFWVFEHYKCYWTLFFYSFFVCTHAQWCVIH